MPIDSCWYLIKLLQEVAMKYFIGVLVMLLAFSSCDKPSEQYRKIRVSDYLDKMKAGWVGQMVGVGWGGPTEFKYQGEIIPANEMPTWQPKMVNQFHQDDIYVEMTFLRTLELYGFDVDIRQAGIDFANRPRKFKIGYCSTLVWTSKVQPPCGRH